MNRFQILGLTAFLGIAWPALAQTTPAPAPSAQAIQPKPPEPDPDPATLKAMRSKIIEIKHRSPMWLSMALKPLSSGIRGCTIYATDNGGVSVISIRDFPENLAAIEEAIKRLDVPGTATQAADVELHVQVLFASRQTAMEGSVPEELQGVIKSLKSSLAYRSYNLAASFIQRWDPSSGRQIEGKGRIDGSALTLGTAKEPSQLRLEWSASPNTSTEQRMKAEATLQIPRFQFAATEEYDYSTDKGSRSGTRNVAQIETSVSLKEGEYVVVGTSMVKDRGLIVVISARHAN
jgi:hypothetical protein